MDRAPDIDWRLAARVSSLRADDLPRLDRHDLTRLVADLRVRSRGAGEIAAEHMGVDSVGAGRIRVVDWVGWGRAAGEMLESTVAELGLPRRPDGALTRLRATGNGVVAGLAVRFAGRRLLGQYDAYSGSDTLYLVAPSIVSHEQRFGFVPADFRLWVALHEQTHALQFRLAPWLRDHIRAAAVTVMAAESSPLSGITDWARGGDLSTVLLGGANAETLGGLSATMSFLEGHADYVADTAGRRHIRTVARLRRHFTRGEATGLARLVQALDKSAQYREGLAFCRAVAGRARPAALQAAFVEPANLPTAAEIADPAAWITRVHG